MMVILAYLSEIQSQYSYFGSPIDHLWKGPQVQWLHTTAQWCVLTRFRPVSYLTNLEAQNVFKNNFQHKFEKFRTLAFHWYQYLQYPNNFFTQNFQKKKKCQSETKVSQLISNSHMSQVTNIFHHLKPLLVQTLLVQFKKVGVMGTHDMETYYYFKQTKVTCVIAPR